ncbi:MAG: hypothetical protein KKA73_24870 [Chloroflexi bacterium]|nr:hypothetical protein [Chloroflexota bacterium]MBU1750929.1 hypothetical protein [Chloroflexota bacterium]
MTNLRIAFCVGLLALSLALAMAGCESAAEPTPAPTWTARVVQVVVTATPSPTPPATPTPTATETPIPSPTATATPVPTDTPVPTATNTPKPKPTRTPAPPPTATTPPYDFVILSGPAGERTPATTNFKGYVYDAAGQPLNGVWLYLRENSGWEAWTVTGYSADPPGYYSYGLKDYSVNGAWGLCIVREQGSREAISPWASFQTSFDLEISTFTTDWKRTY